ncbi:hypothetical protein J7M00_08195 [bacterium]|nr:hypothetical protein [bacterium]
MMRNIHIGKMELGWEDIEKFCKILIERIEENFFPDVVIGVSRAGLIPALIVANHFDADFVPAIAKYICDYDGEVEVSLPDIKALDNSKILIVDDITISGKTFFAVKNKIGGDSNVIKFASLFCHPQFFIPDFYAQKTKVKLIFPWDKKL